VKDGRPRRTENLIDTKKKKKGDGGRGPLSLFFMQRKKNKGSKEGGNETEV